MNRKIYLATSWRNEQQPAVLAALRAEGHEVYDFRNPGPGPGNEGFSWRHVDGTEDWKKWSLHTYIHVLETSPVAAAGFKLDRDTLNWCDTCVCLLPCGKSAHLEAGYAAGQGKDVLFLLSETGFELELMYLLGDGLCSTVEEMVVALRTTKRRMTTVF